MYVRPPEVALSPPPAINDGDEANPRQQATKCPFGKTCDNHAGACKGQPFLCQFCRTQESDFKGDRAPSSLPGGSFKLGSCPRQAIHNWGPAWVMADILVDVSLQLTAVLPLPAAGAQRRGRGSAEGGHPALGEFFLALFSCSSFSPYSPGATVCYELSCVSPKFIG